MLNTQNRLTVSYVSGRPNFYFAEWLFFDCRQPIICIYCILFPLLLFHSAFCVSYITMTLFLPYKMRTLTLLIFGAFMSAIYAAEPNLDDFVAVADDQWTFVGRESQAIFVPWGTSLAFPYSALNKDFKAACTWDDAVYNRDHLEKAFRVMRDLNINVVKIPLTSKTFLKGVTSLKDYRINPAAIARFEQVLELCRTYGIRIMVQAPNHWGGGGHGIWGEQEIGSRIDALDILVKFWEDFVPAYKDDPIIFAWSLCVEKEVYHPTQEAKYLDQQTLISRTESTDLTDFAIKMDPARATRIKAHHKNDFIVFLKEKYISLAALNTSWSTALSSWDQITFAANENNVGNQQLYDTQLYRHWVGVRWVRRQAEAIRRVDSNHLIGVGLVQRNFPLARQKHGEAGNPRCEIANAPATYGALSIREIAQHVDFLDPHFYPITFPEKAKEMEYLKAYLRYCYVGKPLILGEFGHGRAEVMADWNRLNIESSIGLASGWMPWQLHNTQGMGDHVTQVSGLVEEDFTTLTEWGRTFQSLKQKLDLNNPAQLARKDNDTVVFELDMRKFLTGAAENEPHSGYAYFDELETMVKIGGEKLRFKLVE